MSLITYVIATLLLTSSSIAYGKFHPDLYIPFITQDNSGVILAVTAVIFAIAFMYFTYSRDVDYLCSKQKGWPSLHV